MKTSAGTLVTGGGTSPEKPSLVSWCYTANHPVSCTYILEAAVHTACTRTVLLEHVQMTMRACAGVVTLYWTTGKLHLRKCLGYDARHVGGPL